MSSNGGRLQRLHEPAAEKAAAVAYDVAKPGEEFHVPKDKEGHFTKRKVETFDKGDDKNQGEVTFVFGWG